MTYDVKLIDLGDKIECLVAKREPVLVALYQPKLDLTVTDIGGPCYDSNRKDSILKVGTFLSHANKLGSQLIVLPEFATPIEILIDICKGTLGLAEGTLLVLPLEALSLAEYEGLPQKIGAVSRLVLGGLGRTHAGITWVNACAIVAVTRDGVEIFVQLKRYASPLEQDTLCCGSDYFVFKGNGIAMSVFVCADANESHVYRKQIDETRKVAPGHYFIHTQWNQKPTYDLYYEFWRIIMTTDPANNILISLNMATKSGIRKSGTTENILLPLARVACSGDAKRDEKYMTSKTYTAFKSIFRDNKWGTIYNLAYPYDSLHFLVLRRPYELVSDTVNMTRTFLISSQIFLFSNGAISEYQQEDLTLAFVKYLNDKYGGFKKEIFDQITSLIFEDIEILIASCLQEEKYTWLKNDLISRPFIWSTFFSPLGIPSEYSQDSIDFFVTTLKKLEQCEVLGYHIMPFETINKYPINLIGDDDGYGWIFNCRGLSDVSISERVSTSLRSIGGISKGSTVTLFPTNYTTGFRADVFEKQVMRAARNISEPFDTLSKNFDVRTPDSNPEIRIIPL